MACEGLSCGSMAPQVPAQLHLVEGAHLGRSGTLLLLPAAPAQAAEIAHGG
jgi:hypothetical protein